MAIGPLMDLKQIYYFLSVADNGSFSRASEKLYIAQTALSRQIRMLEESLDIELFIRHGRGVVLTQAGELLYSKSQDILKAVNQTKTDVTALSGKVAGKVTLGIIPTMCTALQCSIIEEYSTKYPQVSLAVVSALNGTLQQMVLQQRVDLALTYEPRKGMSLSCMPLVEEKYFLIGPANSPYSDEKSIHMQEVLDLPLALSSEKQGLHSVILKAASKLNKRLNLKYEMSAWPLTLEIVKRGLAYSILPVNAVLDELDKQELIAIEIVSPNLTRKLVLASPSDGPTSIAAVKMMDLIKERVESLNAKGRWKGELLTN